MALLERALAAEFAKGANAVGSRAGLATVDGRGVHRVRAAVLLDADTVLVTRPATADDEGLLLEWANDPTARRYSFSHPTIGAAEHRLWLATKLNDPGSCVFLIVQTEDAVPLGTVRFDKKDDQWVVNYSVAPAYRGRGLGRRLLELGLARLRQTGRELPVVGRVAAANVPSHKVFIGLGFAAVVAADGIVEYRSTL